MDRYAVISKGMSVSQMVEEVKRFGGRNIKVATLVGQVFCELDNAGASKLNEIEGLSVKPLKKISAADVIGRVIPPEPGPGPLEVPIYASSQATLASELFQLREVLDPPITGAYSTLCILDSGIRHTHEGLKNKVIYEANFSDSPTCEDIYDHGTGVAYCAAGGRHSIGEECGSAPGAKLWSIKVLDDDGAGSEENVVMALEFCIEKRLEAIDAGLSSMEPEFPNQINLSFGSPDEGDPDNPIRVACRAAVDAGFGVYAAAGNSGPSEGTIMMPACDPSVIAVGAVTFVPFEVWELSSRGPTKEGLTKPDFVFFGVRTLTASSKSDDAFVVKSGTSFSTPYINGLGAVGVELMIRTFGETVGMVDPMATLKKQVEEVWEMYAPTGLTLTVKPEGYPVISQGVYVKDNVYGFGMPLGSLISQSIMPTVGIENVITPLIGIGMMGMVAGAVARGMKK